jgi:LmbE family N-acetylglucosaminyl deacetylase
MTHAPFLDRLDGNAVIVFVGAHPDDETLVGPLLAYAADRGKEVIVVCLTPGESGWNLDKEDLTRTLAQVRQAEFQAAMSALGATAVMWDYVNGLSKAHPRGLAVLELEQPALARWKTDGTRNETPPDILARWTGTNGDPARRLADYFRQKQPAAVITFDPETGFTRHREHMAVSLAVLDAVAEYNRSAAPKAALYYTLPAVIGAEGVQSILVDDLTKAGPRDYDRVAQESFGCYRSQYRLPPPAGAPAEPSQQRQIILQPVVISQQ